MTDGNQPWNAMKDETPENFHAFTVYRDIGPGRTFKAVAEQLGRGVAEISRVAMAHSWRSRALARDNHLDRIKTDADDDLVAQLRRRQMQVGSKALDLGERVLDHWLEELKADRPFTIKDIALRDVERLVRLGVELHERAAPLMPRDKRADLALLSDAELDTWMHLKRKMSGTDAG